ncbi:hypothetical protein M426DRAFT_134403 [Hypoxylon sp. CI-4A]|nr:hypothetical protein M426DRAFT_134403 [Hypoxylon sp. CI-4A]
MHPPSRQAASVIFQSRVWRGPSRSPLATDAEFQRLYNPLFSRALIHIPIRTPCCQHFQIRGYSERNPTSRAVWPPPLSYSTLAKQGAEEADIELEKAKNSEPLRILFCGSDEFSCASLRALHDELQVNPELIQSINVVVRPSKRTGRGYKVLQHPPIRKLAEDLGLPIHERDTFTGWDMPPHINLIIAVSFGLFVPPRLLRAAKFGGLNVHPSILPDLRGPAPLQHAILQGRPSTGVSLQTLDAERFDHGRVLLRSTPPIRLDSPPFPHVPSYPELLARVKPAAASLLVDGLRRRVHVPPVREAPLGEEHKRYLESVGEKQLAHAPKITSRDRQIRVESDWGQRLLLLHRRHLALGPLWFWSRDRGGGRKRVILERVTVGDDDDDDEGGDASSSSRVMTTMTTMLQRAASPTLSLPASASASTAVEQVADRLRGLQAADKPVFAVYLVPFEGETESDDDDDAAENNSEPRITYLVAFVSQKPGRDDGGVVYVGPYHRIHTVKVEGQKSKPAVQALRDFLVPVPT